ncbi:MAG: lipocalin family protein, partial [Desulfobacterales bacterium]|jgi:apolipoprotein D and lipocalin family protein
VVNRGYDPTRQQWKEAVGKAYPYGDPNVGRLKVSFWGPFYSSYNIIDLDTEDYAYAMVCGPTTSYLWILARTPQMEPSLKALLIDKAQALGFATDKLIYVAH